MESKKKNIPIEFSNYEIINDTVSRVKIYVQYAGKNRNYSYFTRESIEEALPSMYGVPVVGEYSEQIDNFKGHGGRLEIDDDGIRYVETTKPYGFVSLDKDLTDARWETVTDEFGNSKEYLVVNAYLWRKKYPELDVVFEKSSNQSMEIEVIDGEFMEDGYFDIQKFTYDVLCILGRDEEDMDKNTEPCFEDSRVISYSLDKETFKSEFSLMVSEIKESLKTAYAVEDKINHRKELDMEDLKEMEAVEVETQMELQEKDEVAIEKTDVEPAEIVSDFEEEVSERVEDDQEEFKSAEEVEAIEETQVETDYKALYEDLKESYDNLQNDYNLLKSENETNQEELNSYKVKEREEAEQELFAKYNSLEGNAKFDDLKLKANDYNLEELNKELAVIFVEVNNKFNVKETKKDILVSEKFSTKEKEECKYGDLFDKHGRK